MIAHNWGQRPSIEHQITVFLGLILIIVVLLDSIEVKVYKLSWL